MTDQELSSSQRLLLTLKKARAKIDRLEREPIAIIGMGCRFPGGANNLEQFWQLLAQGQDAIVEVPPSRWNIDDYYDPQQGVLNKTYAKDAGYLQHPIEEFDPQFFGMAPLEAQHLDPQHRLLLEVTWEALENANLPADKLPVATGIYLGIMDTETATYDDSYDVYATTGTGTAMASGRLAYTLGVQGPNVSINTVCSSSLVALHLACQGLRASECEVAICGGVNILLTPDSTIALSQMQAISPDGRCKTFSAQADGYGRGEGCGMVVLKLLSDAVEAGDNIWAVIHGSAVNHNGPSSGLTVPNKVAQVALLQQALAKAHVEGQQMSYVEAHGTGTKLGDPIELNALAEALGKRDTSLLIGSVKTNIGHLEAAAGIAGIIKVALSLHHQAIPPHLHFYEPSPYMDWANLPFQVPTALTPWPRGEQPRYAGVSSFGLSGTNSHAILGEAPNAKEANETNGAKERLTHILTLSGRTEQALADQVAQYRGYLVETGHALSLQPSLADVCYTANTGRVHFEHRLAVVADTIDELVQKLEREQDEKNERSEISRVSLPFALSRSAFLFTGQGAQYIDMGRELYEIQPLFRQIMQQCDELLRPHLDVSLLKVIFSSVETGHALSLLDETQYTQPALFALEYALAKLWQSWGIEPELVMGHSVGEYAAACLAGVFSLEDGLTLIAARGRLMQQLPERGGMVAVQLDEVGLLPYLKPYQAQVSIASYNAPRSLVISGQSAALEQIVTQLQADGIKCTSLTVSHAFHSPLMSPMLAEFERVAKSITYHAPQIELISNLTGQVVTVIDAAYWVKHVSAPVRFAQGITAAAKLEVTAFIEIGPKPTLLGLGQQSYELKLKTHYSSLITPLWLPSLYPKQMSDTRQMLESLGRLYEHGAKVDWYKVDAQRQKVLLPTYPFQRKRYWLDRKLQKSEAGNSGHALLGSRLPALATSSEIAFQNQLSATSPFYLNDHRIFSQTIFPGAAYVEVVLAAGTEIFEGEAFSLADITFQNPLVLTEQMTTVQIILTSQDEGYRWQLFSWHEEQKEWLLHGAGQLLPNDKPRVTSRLSLIELQKACPQVISINDYYQNFAEQGLEYGPEFQAIEQLYQGETEALGLVRLSPSLQLEAKNYHLHPALLDACLQVSGATLPVDPEITFLPFAIDHVWLHRSGAEVVWAYARLRMGESVETGHALSLQLDITLLTETGDVVAEIIGLTVRPMNRQALLGRKLRTDWLYELTWQDSPLPQQSPFSHENGTWLIINPDLQGFENLAGLALADLLRAKGERVVLNDELGVMSETYRGVIYFVETGHALSLQNMPDATLQLSTQTLTIVQQLIKATPKPQLWLITKNSDHDLEIDRIKSGKSLNHGQNSSLITSPLWGLGKTLMWEHPELNCRCIDLDAATPVEMLFKAIWQADDENQIKLHNGQRQVARLTRLTPEEIERHQPPYPFQAQLQQYGLLDTLKLSPAQRRVPELYQVEVEMHAVGINFRDVLNALGMLKEYYAPELGYDDPKRVPFGFEGAGRIVAIGSQVTRFAVGDEVIVWDCWGALASHVMVDCDNVTLKPSHLSFEEAATIPITFMTAYYGLHDLAHMQAGDRVLIHAAAGGVGQAAIQLAQLAGAEVLATASPPKWEFLKANGLEHVMNSRTLEFADQIPTLTNGHGVDIVLNSLNGDFIPKSFDVLAAGGRFIEISKIDTWSKQQAAEYRPDVAYHPFDLNLTLESTRETLRTRLLELFNHQQLKPLPYHTFSIDQIGAAFQFMAQAKNIGKVVVTLGHGRDLQGFQNLAGLTSSASYLITGGLGGLGLKVATWLAEQGARHLVLSGRQGAESVAAQQAVAELETLGAKVTVIKADVSQKADVARLIAQSQALAPLRGIIHAAGVIDDGLLHQQTPDRFAKVFAPKVAGSWYLHQLSQELPLDFFVCFSSAASLLGNAGQANYAAANAFMDSLMVYRQAHGLPGLSLNWGGWSEVGMAEREKAKGREKLEDLISPQQGIDLLAYLLPQNLVQVGILPFRWATTFQHAPRLPFIAHLLKAKTKAKAKTGLGQQWVEVALEERLALLKQHISQEIEFILGLSPAPDQGFFDLGLDSLTSIQLANRLTVNLEVPLPTTIALEYPTVERLATHLAESVLGWHAQPEPIKATSLPALTRQMMTVDEAQFMTQLTQLSADEIEAAIAAKLAYLDSLLDE